METKYFYPKTVSPATVPEKKIQTKLEVTPPHDEYEQEADMVADKVSLMTENSPDHLQMLPKKDEEEKVRMKLNDYESLRMQPEPEEEEDKIQMKTNNSGFENAPKVSSELAAQLESTKGQGNPFPENARREMGQKIGGDFSNVRVHNDVNAVQMNKELGAQAFTHGNDIYFNKGKYNPESPSGKHLLAHELTHVIQQAGKSVISGRSINSTKTVETKGSRLEDSNLLTRRSHIQREETDEVPTVEQEIKDREVKTKPKESNEDEINFFAAMIFAESSRKTWEEDVAIAYSIIARKKNKSIQEMAKEPGQYGTVTGGKAGKGSREFRAFMGNFEPEEKTHLPVKQPQTMEEYATQIETMKPRYLKLAREVLAGTSKEENRIKGATNQGGMVDLWGQYPTKDKNGKYKGEAKDKFWKKVKEDRCWVQIGDTVFVWPSVDKIPVLAKKKFGYHNQGKYYSSPDLNEVPDHPTTIDQTSDVIDFPKKLEKETISRAPDSKDQNYAFQVVQVNTRYRSGMAPSKPNNSENNLLIHRQPEDQPKEKPTTDTNIQGAIPTIAYDVTQTTLTEEAVSKFTFETIENHILSVQNHIRILQNIGKDLSSEEYMALKENLRLLEGRKYKAFVEIKPNTNKEYAEWILKADELGFIIYGMFGNNDKAQFLNIKEDKDIQGLSPKGPVFKGLTLIFEIVKKTIEKWIGDRMTTSKPQTSLGSFVRRTDKEGYHFSGNAIDIPLDPTHQMLKDILESLPEGEYGIGLPFKDGNDGFFPSANHLKNFDEEANVTGIDLLQEDQDVYKAKEELKPVEEAERGAQTKWEKVKSKLTPEKKKELEEAENILKKANDELSKSQENMDNAMAEVEKKKPEEQKTYEKAVSKTLKAKNKVYDASTASLAKKEALKKDTQITTVIARDGLLRYNSHQQQYTCYLNYPSSNFKRYSDPKDTNQSVEDVLYNGAEEIIKAAKTRRLKLIVFPDKPGHIHIDKR